MDALKYLAARAKGQASMVSHGAETILVSVPDGFDPETGEPKPNRDTGYQRADIENMANAAFKAVEDAQAALDKAIATQDAFFEIMDEVDHVVANGPKE